MFRSSCSTEYTLRDFCRLTARQRLVDRSSDCSSQFLPANISLAYFFSPQRSKAENSSQYLAQFWRTLGKQCAALTPPCSPSPPRVFRKGVCQFCALCSQALPCLLVGFALSPYASSFSGRVAPCEPSLHPASHAEPRFVL